MANELQNLPEANKLMESFQKAPKGYIGPKEIAPALQEINVKEAEAKKSLAESDIRLKEAERQEKATEAELKKRFYEDEKKYQLEMPERIAEKEARKELAAAKFEPTKDNIQDIAGLFSLMGVVGMVIGKQNAIQGMYAMNGMMEGHIKGRKDLFTREAAEFDKQFKILQAKVESATKELEEARKLRIYDQKAGEEALAVAVARSESPMIKEMVARVGPAYTINILNQTKETINGMVKTQNDLQKAADDRALRKSMLDFKKQQVTAKTAADRYGFGDIVASASNEAAAAIKNLMGLPFESTSGFFGGKQTNSLFTAPLDALANTLTSESVQRYNAQSGKLGYNLAQLMSGGRAVRVSDVDQMNKILQIKEGDTLETAATRIAEARQLAERTMEVRARSPNTPPGLREVFQENLDTVKSVVPFTVDDINKFVTSRDKSTTFSEALSKRYSEGTLGVAEKPAASTGGWTVKEKK
jgi:hypothetical protein